MDTEVVIVLLKVLVAQGFVMVILMAMTLWTVLMNVVNQSTRAGLPRKTKQE